MHYLLFYDVVDDYVARRVPLRAAHIGHARESLARGELVLAGAFNNPPDGAALLFKGSSPEVAERFAEQDPYVINGLVKKWRVREWTTVVGRDAEVQLPDTLGPAARCRLRRWRRLRRGRVWSRSTWCAAR